MLGNIPALGGERTSKDLDEERNLIIASKQAGRHNACSVKANYVENPFSYALSAVGRGLAWAPQSSRNPSGGYVSAVPTNSPDQRSNPFKERFTEKGKLPDEVVKFYNKLELTSGIKLDTAARRLYYEEFYKKASEYDMLHSSEVENLIVTRLGFDVDPNDLAIMIKKKMDDSAESYNDGVYGEEAFFSFELFASLVCDLLQSQKLNRNSRMSAILPDQSSPITKSKQVIESFVSFS
jgi:hypothetical protein